MFFFDWEKHKINRSRFSENQFHKKGDELHSKNIFVSK